MSECWPRSTSSATGRTGSRGSSSSGARALGVVVGDLGNSFYGELVKRFERRAHVHGFTTVVSNTDGSVEGESERVAAFLERRIAGLALLQLSGDGALAELLRAEAVPAVVVSSTDPLFDSVGVDEPRGVSLAVSHLAALGHRRLAYVTGCSRAPRRGRARRRAGSWRRTT